MGFSRFDNQLGSFQIDFFCPAWFLLFVAVRKPPPVVSHHSSLATHLLRKPFNHVVPFTSFTLVSSPVTFTPGPAFTGLQDTFPSNSDRVSVQQRVYSTYPMFMNDSGQQSSEAILHASAVSASSPVVDLASEHEGERTWLRPVGHFRTIC